MHLSKALLFCAATLALAAMPSYAELIGYYPLANGANDASGHGNNGVFSNPSPTPVAAAGHDGQNTYLFGGGSYLTVPLDTRPTALPAVTMGGWFKPSNASPISTLISLDDGGYDRELDIDYRGGNISWSAFTGSGVLASGIAPSTTEWTFVAITYDQANNSVVLTVNNDSFTGVTNFGSNSHGSTTIGTNPTFTDESYSGLIQDVFFYDNALSQAQLQDIRQNGIQAAAVAPEPGSVALIGFGLIAAGCLALPRRRS